MPILLSKDSVGEKVMNKSLDIFQTKKTSGERFFNSMVGITTFVALVQGRQRTQDLNL